VIKLVDTDLKESGLLTNLDLQQQFHVEVCIQLLQDFSQPCKAYKVLKSAYLDKGLSRLNQESAITLESLTLKCILQIPTVFSDQALVRFCTVLVSREDKSSIEEEGSSLSLIDFGNGIEVAGPLQKEALAKVSKQIECYFRLASHILEGCPSLYRDYLGQLKYYFRYMVDKSVQNQMILMMIKLQREDAAQFTFLDSDLVKVQMEVLFEPI